MPLYNNGKPGMSCRHSKSQAIKKAAEAAFFNRYFQPILAA
jgi:hypothetical protein